jgi:hypothetical protein
VLGALLHFKIFSDFPQRVDAAVADGQYWSQAKTYKTYQSRLKDRADMVFACDQSAIFESIDQLSAMGIIERIDWS